MGGGLTISASPATKNSFTMTVGYRYDQWTESDTGGDHNVGAYRYGLDIFTNPNANIGSITPQNIGTFKINTILNTESYDELVDGTELYRNYDMFILANHKCLISFKGRTYRVDTQYGDYYKYDSSADYIVFTDGEKVEITYELL